MRLLNSLQIKAFLLYPIALLIAVSISEAQAPRKTVVPKRTAQPNPHRLARMELLACKTINPQFLTKPKITITSFTRPSLLSKTYHVEGYIDGVCVREAGYYENGERLIKFPLKTSRAYSKYPFKLDVKLENKPEIRAFNVNWGRVAKMLEPPEVPPSKK